MHSLGEKMFRLSTKMVFPPHSIPAECPLLPDADGLLLVCQVNPPVVVVGLDCAGARSVIEVLRAPGRGEVRVRAGVLGNLGNFFSFKVFS